MSLDALLSSNIRVQRCFYREFEPDLHIYNTNDEEGKYIKEKYSLFTAVGEEHFETIEETAKYVERWIGKKVEPDYTKIEESIDEYLSELEEKEDEDYYDENWLYILQIDYVDDEVCRIQNAIVRAYETGNFDEVERLKEEYINKKKETEMIDVVS